MQDQVKFLQQEAEGPHAVFHQFILALNRYAKTACFFFFEGAEDPTFFSGHLLPVLKDRESYEFVCDGRSGVLKVHELCERDGRALQRCFFFVDKDHTEICEEVSELPINIFQTYCYSFENYLVCQQTLRRFWTERLRLRSVDPRMDFWLLQFQKLHISFFKKMKIMMAIVLIGRGIDGQGAVKLNLNNVNLEKVLVLDLMAATLTWREGALDHFLASTNMQRGPRISTNSILAVYRRHLRGRDPKTYSRGKYELWFFVRFLSALSRNLSDKASARAAGLQRATPGDIINSATAIDSLSSLAPCPTDLHKFLEIRLAST